MVVWLENVKYSTSVSQACWLRKEMTHIHNFHHGVAQKRLSRSYDLAKCAYVTSFIPPGDQHDNNRSGNEFEKTEDESYCVFLFSLCKLL